MRTPRLYLAPERAATGNIVLRPAEVHYLTVVLRLPPAARVTLFDGRGQESEAALANLDGQWSLAPAAWRLMEPAPAAPLILCLSLHREKNFSLVLQKATELGVHRIIPVAAARDVVRLDPARTAQRLARWRRIMAQAAAQSRRADLPELDEPVKLDVLAEQRPADLCLVGWEKAGGVGLGNLGELIVGQSLAILIGPEGGFEDAEIERLQGAGWLTVSLGRRILRVETAAIAALSILQAQRGEFR